MWRGLHSLWILILSFTWTEQSHFQGASVTWRPGQIFPEENTTEILADFRIVWKRLSNQLNSTYCDDSDIENGALLGDSDSSYGWTCKSGCNVTKASFDAVCTQYSVRDDWSLGKGIAKFNITGDGDFEIYFGGCCWISTLAYISDPTEHWSANISGNVGIRSDTKKPNHSPIATATPVIRFQAGCPNFVDFLMHDEDGDNVICRTADCAQTSCSSHPYLKVTQQGEKCRLSYNAGGPGDVSVVITLILEDYPRLTTQHLFISGVLQNTTNKLSSVQVQFLVNIFTDTGTCNQKPEWNNDDTLPNGLIKMATVGQQMTMDVSLKSEMGINSLNIVGPERISRSPWTGPNEDNEYSTSLTFTPSIDQQGEHMLSLTAIDDNGKMSEQKSLIIKVGTKSPCEIDNGGCDDKCVTVGQSYYCECDRDCWQLADDKRKCIPAIEVRCLPDRFSLELPVCAVSAPTVSIGFEGPPGSSAPCEANSNGTYYNSEFYYDDCETQTQSDFMEIHYRNKVRIWVDDVKQLPGSGEETIPITRGFFYNMQLVCSFNRYANVNATFRPQDQEENSVQVPGLGSFQFFFDFYYDDQFGAAYSPYEYPITVTVNSDIYFGIRTVGGSGLEVFTEKCVAMTTPTPTESTISYTMIENGCLEDETMQEYTAANKMEDRYSVKAFRFQDNLNTDSSVNIYIQGVAATSELFLGGVNYQQGYGNHSLGVTGVGLTSVRHPRPKTTPCSAVLCVVGEETRCSKGCVRTRKRRDGQNEIFVDNSNRYKRSVDEEESDSQTAGNNVSESHIIQITVSGPFRIDVERLSSTQLVTVVTPTEKNTDNEEVEKEPNAEESGQVIIIASSVGGSLFAILLLTITAMVAYYHCILKPKHKVLPDSSPMPQAWTEDWDSSSQYHSDVKQYPETPPPYFSSHSFPRHEW